MTSSASSPRPPNDGLPWTREQLILAFELYCRIPFGRITTRNPQVQELAGILGRTPASVARKLGNFGAFDPVLAARNVAGLTHGSKLDRAIWDEFQHDWGALAVQAHDLRVVLAPPSPRFALESGRGPGGSAEGVRGSSPLLPLPDGPSERLATVKQRLHQSFFRDAVLSSYNGRCCITGIPITECLVAGHIIPWSVNEQRRADPTNGVCLSATFDRLFDAGLITITPDLTLLVSDRLRSLAHSRHPPREADAPTPPPAPHTQPGGPTPSPVPPANLPIADITARHGQKVEPPARFHPDPACLEWHQAHVFAAA